MRIASGKVYCIALTKNSKKTQIFCRSKGPPFFMLRCGRNGSEPIKNNFMKYCQQYFFSYYTNPLGIRMYTKLHYITFVNGTKEGMLLLIEPNKKR